jgi:hypothetical protein
MSQTTAEVTPAAGEAELRERLAAAIPGRIRKPGMSKR